MLTRIKAGLFAALWMLMGAQLGTVHAATVNGVIVEDKTSSWLRLMDAAKYDEAKTWLGGRLGVQSVMGEPAQALRALHAEHGPTTSRLLRAKELDTPGFERSFSVKTTVTFINNATAEERVRVGLMNGEWRVFGYEVLPAED